MARELPRVTVYTDGACEPNPGPGGWAAVLLREGEAPTQLCGGERATTNNRMELRAALEALHALAEPHDVTLFSDSTYLVEGFAKLRPGRAPGLFGTAEPTPVVNGDLWDALAEEKARHRVTCQWLAGHAGHEWNELADKLARSQIPRPRPAPPADGTVYVWTAVCDPVGRSPGAWAVLLTCEGRRKPRAEAVPGASANRLQLLVSVAGLRAVRPTTRPVVLITASDYVHSGLTRWYPGWVDRNWRTHSGSVVQNRDLWEALKAEADRLRATCQRYVSSDATGLMAECWELARAAARGQPV